MPRGKKKQEKGQDFGPEGHWRRQVIIEKYGDQLEDKKQVLCSVCNNPVSRGVSGCNLLPITVDGEDCPYYVKG